MAPTDSEDRHVAAEGLPGERQLEVVPPPVDPPELRVGGLAVEDGVHVHAAGQQDAVQPVEEGRDVPGRDRGQHDRHGSRLLDGPDVVLAHGVDARLVAVPERDPDHRPHHIRSGTGMPRRPSSTSIWRTKASTTRVRPARRSSVSA